MQHTSIYPVHTCPVNIRVVLFEQWGDPFVGWFQADGHIGFASDQYTGHHAFDTPQLRVNKRDIVGWLPLPTKPIDGDWRSYVTYSRKLPMGDELILHAVYLLADTQHLANLMQNKGLIRHWLIDENGPDGVGGRGALRLKIQPLFEPGPTSIPQARNFIKAVDHSLFKAFFTQVGTMHNEDPVYHITSDTSPFKSEFGRYLYVVVQTAISDQITLDWGYVSLIPYSFNPV